MHDEVTRILSEVFLKQDKRIPWSKLGRMRQELYDLPVHGRIWTEVENRNLYRAAKETGIKITRRRLPYGGWVYERIS